MGVELTRSEEACEDDLEHGSATRLRAAPAEGPFTARESQSLATTLLQPHERELRTLARRLVFSRGASFVSSWLEHCARSSHLAEESSDYPEPIRRAAGPLLDSLGNGRLELAELHACELFTDLRELCLSSASVIDVVDAFDQAAALQLSGPEWSSAIRVLGRFMTCSALGVFSKPDPMRAMIESSERTRPPRKQESAQSGRLVGKSSQVVRLRAQLQDIARAPGSVLIVGESGTGKELVAQAIHELGDFREHPFVAVNCAALPRELFESELFGHEHGAFTGSRGSGPGLLRAAGEGTLFLDEVTETPEALQPKLLRALEQRAVRPVGGLREVPVRARIVAATNADPERSGECRGLRPDLFYRLCVHRVDVPPLRDRVEDVPLLIEHFLRELEKSGHRTPSAFAASSLELLAGHHWPGNVRELRNVVEHCCATAKGGRVEPVHLPRRLAERLTAPATSSGTPVAKEPVSDADSLQLLPLKLVERRHIERALELVGGNKARAARLLGLSRHQLYLKLQRSNDDR